MGDDLAGHVVRCVAGEIYDEPDKIVRDAAASDYRWSSIILGITKSDVFQMRMPARW